jgi:uncharacterized protein YndB with AHSA1/START domain/DNA-binding transcriptional ArsR family regulator
MDQVVAALAEPSRWRMMELLADRPRSVGELAELTGVRQPQATKHLQVLSRAGLVTAYPLGQRRVYAVEATALESLERRLRELVELAAAQDGERDVLARYRAAIGADAAAAHGDRWADGRSFAFRRVLAAPPEVVWRHWVEPGLLAAWWAPSSMTVDQCLLEPRRGGRVVLEYRDAEGRYLSEGRVTAAHAPERLAFDLSVLDPDGAVSFTGHHDLRLAAVHGRTRLDLALGITDTTAGAVPFVAGIETGWSEVLDNLAAAVEAPRRPARPTRKRSTPRGKRKDQR